MTVSHLAIRAEGIGKRFLIGTKAERPTLLQNIRRWTTGGQPQRELWALRDVDLELHRGDVLGIIGANGAGKSTLLMLIARILTLSEGTLDVFGKVNPFFHLAAGLQPELTVSENISICAALLGVANRDLKKRLPEIIEFSGLEKYLFAKLGELSTGLAARLPFTTAIHADADILLVDEMLSVGDIAFQDQCITALRKLIRQGKTVVVVSHNLNLIRRLCPTVLYLKSGERAFLGSYEEAVARFTQDMGVSAPASTPQVFDRSVQELQVEVRETGGKILAAIEELRQTQKRTQDPSAAPSKTPSYSEAVRAWKTSLQVSGPLTLSDSFLSSIWVAVAAAMSPRTSPFLKVGDEVITPAYNYSGVLAALRIQGLAPVQTDLNPRSFNLDVDLIERSLTSKTRAVLVPHLAGTSAPMDEISAYCRDKGLLLIELNHYAMGSFRGTALGTFGDFGACGLQQPIQPPWGIFLSRKDVLSDIFSLSEAPARRMAEVLGRVPRISLAGLEASLATCRQIEVATPVWKGMQSDYARFFSQFPDGIRVPSCPGADINNDRFTIILDPQAPISAQPLAQKLTEAGFGCRRYLPLSGLEESNMRLVNSRLLLEQGITVELCERQDERQRFFSAFASYLRHKAIS